MKASIGKLLRGCVVATLVLAATSAHGKPPGHWICDDGGDFYVEWVGDDVWWYGESPGDSREWATVFHGRRQGDVITGKWTDVPKGRRNASGDLSVRIEGTRMVRTHATGGFTCSGWRSEAAPAPATACRVSGRIIGTGRPTKVDVINQQQAVVGGSRVTPKGTYVVMVPPGRHWLKAVGAKSNPRPRGVNCEGGAPQENVDLYMQTD